MPWPGMPLLINYMWMILIGRVLHGSLTKDWSIPGKLKELGNGLTRNWEFKLKPLDGRKHICSLNITDESLRNILLKNPEGMDNFRFHSIMTLELIHTMGMVELIRSNASRARKLAFFYLAFPIPLTALSSTLTPSAFNVFLVVFNIAMFISTLAWHASNAVSNVKLLAESLLDSLKRIEGRCYSEISVFNQLNIDEELASLKSAVSCGEFSKERAHRNQAL